MAIAGLYDCFNHWAERGTVWLYSDPHFNDPEIIAGVRPGIRPSADEMVKMINSKVGRKDTIIFLGDIGDLECAKKIHGYKVLIAGNHDCGLSAYKKEKYVRRFSAIKFEDKRDAVAEMQKLYPNCSYHVTHGYLDEVSFDYWEVVADNCLFDEVYSGALFIGEKIVLSHEPIDIPFALNIHGHVHDWRHKEDFRHINICCDACNDYYPVNFNQLMKKGPAAHIQSIHRETINKATQRKKKRGNKKKVVHYE